MSAEIILILQIVILLILIKFLGNEMLWNRLMDKLTEGWREPKGKTEAKAQMGALAMSMKIREGVPGLMGIVFSSYLIFLVLDFVLINKGYDYMILTSIILIIIVISRIRFPAQKPKLNESEMKMAGKLLKNVDLSQLFGGGGNGDGGTGDDREPDS